MNHTTYIKNLFYSFLKDDTNLTENIMFIKHYNTLQLNLEEIEKIVGDHYKDGLLYHGFAKNDIKEPYEPFMNGVRYYYQKFFSDRMSVQEFVDACNVYSLHNEIFVSYLMNGRAERQEMIIISEVLFEKKKFIESIINCFRYIAKHQKILIVLNRLRFAGLSTIRFIEQILEQGDICGAKFMIIYNELQQPFSYIERDFDKIIKIAEDRNILFEWENDVEYISRDYHSAFIPNRRFFGEYLRKINNLYYMLALEDADYYINVIHSRITEDRLNIDDNDRFEFYIYACFCNVLVNDSNSAIMMSERLVKVYDKSDKYRDYMYNYVCGHIHMMMVQSDTAIKYAKQCRKLALEIDDEKLIFKADVLYHGAQYSGWKDVFAIDFGNVAVDEKFTKDLRKYHYTNTLIHYLIYGYDNDYESIKKIVEGTPSPTYEEAVRIGKKLGNSDFLLTAYTKYIVLFTERGFNRYSDGYYKEKLKIIENEKNEIRQSHLLMGMGYNSILCENCSEADKYFSEAIVLLYQLHEAEGIVETLYNMAENSMFAEDYMLACEYINTIFKMLDNLGMKSIRICNASKLHGLLAVSYYRMGNEYRCYRNVGKMEILISHILYHGEDEYLEYCRWNEDLFLYYMLKGILEKLNKDYESAGENFEKAMIHFNECSEVAFYGLTTFISEYYKYFIEVGEKNKAEKIAEIGMKYCRSNGFEKKMNDLELLLREGHVNAKPLPLLFDSISKENLIDLSYNIGIEKKLDERKKDIRFLSAWQEMLNSDDIEYNVLIHNAMLNIQNSFNFDGILFIDTGEGDIKEIYKDIDDSDMNYEELMRFFKMVKKEFIANRTDKIFFEYEKVVSLFGKNKIATLVGIPVYNENDLGAIFMGTVNMHRNFERNGILMDEDDLMIIKTAIIQLCNGIERIRSKINIVEMNERLRQLAITDMLTGLYNRQGFAKMIEYHNNCSNPVSILYADLDNFKYYNDTFGHDVGDVVLKEFAKVFENAARNVGYAVRYGGDEFLVILENTDIAGACHVADMIYESISDGFVSVVSEYMNQNVDIPKEKFVSCSIGIAASENGRLENIEDAMKKADTALYYMKKHSKGSYIVWEDIDETSN